MNLLTVGNVPGLLNAGVTRDEESTGFLLYFGFAQSITDRRLFFLTNEDGLLLIAGTFVGDCKAALQSETIAAEFSKAWKKRYRDTPKPTQPPATFLGSSAFATDR